MACRTGSACRGSQFGSISSRSSPEPGPRRCRGFATIVTPWRAEPADRGAKRPVIDSARLRDRAQTVKHVESSLDFVRETVARGEYVLFVGTKKQAQEPIAQEATRAGQPYVNKRWLGGMLTNFITIKKRIGLLEQLEARQQAGDFERMSKKEAAKLQEELAKLQLTVGGMRKMN